MQISRSLAACLFVAAAALALPKTVLAHCQVPCGIYGDQRRFEQMLEDEQTISKAQVTLGELSEAGPDPQNINQIVRWVNTKEEHASRVMTTISTYFLAQRIKTDDPKYSEKLMAAHKVMLMAMKAKQSADPATAKSLEKAIFDFYRAYEGKEPQFDHKH